MPQLPPIDGVIRGILSHYDASQTSTTPVNGEQCLSQPIHRATSTSTTIYAVALPNGTIQAQTQAPPAKSGILAPFHWRICRCAATLSVPNSETHGPTEIAK
jgi:hypothetical protein